MSSVFIYIVYIFGFNENYAFRFLESHGWLVLLPPDLPYGLVVRIPAFHAGGPGSIPGVGTHFHLTIAAYMVFEVVSNVPFISREAYWWGHIPASRRSWGGGFEPTTFPLFACIHYLNVSKGGWGSQNQQKLIIHFLDACWITFWNISIARCPNVCHSLSTIA